MNRWVVLGNGAWGRALARRLAASGARVELVGEPNVVAQTPPGVTAQVDMHVALRQSERIIVAVPINALAIVLRQAAPSLEGHHRLVTTSRGLTAGERPQRASEVVLAETCVRQTGVLAGAADAEAVESGHPVALVVGSAFPTWAREVQDALTSPTMRVYTNDDPVGVELANALAPLLAIAVGAARQLGVGAASEAMTLTRAMAEMDRLVQTLGGRPGTAHGLAGLGVLANLALEERASSFDAGRALALGDPTASERWPELWANAQAITLGARLAGVRAPLVEAIDALFARRVDAREALAQLMARAMQVERAAGSGRAAG